MLRPSHLLRLFILLLLRHIASSRAFALVGSNRLLGIGPTRHPEGKEGEQKAEDDLRNSPFHGTAAKGEGCAAPSIAGGPAGHRGVIHIGNIVQGAVLRAFGVGRRRLIHGLVFFRLFVDTVGFHGGLRLRKSGIAVLLL